MFEAAREQFQSLLDSPGWVRPLANILPLSALVDFVNVPAVLHTYQLTGSIPLWCWPVTPSGSRLLLAEADTVSVCCLDRYGNGLPVPICLDGRFGDMYPMVNPETIRRCVQASACTRIENTHVNMQRHDTRVQNLEFVHVFRQQHLRSFQAWDYWLFSSLGWLLLLGLFVLDDMLGCWTSLAFSFIVLMTGMLVKITSEGTSRTLNSFRGSAYNRLVLAALHVNETDWQVFYGESTIINALLNKPLKKQTTHDSWYARTMRNLLAFSIFGQWALAIGAAATQDWNSFLVTAWVVVCVFAQSQIFTPVRAARQWMEQSAEIVLKRYQVQLSTRRALLNTIVALNPDTFEWGVSEASETQFHFRRDGLRWIDPILTASDSRKEWLEATRFAVARANGVFLSKDHPSSDDWRQQMERQYWHPFIHEGIEVARKINAEAQLSGRLVGGAIAHSAPAKKAAA